MLPTEVPEAEVGLRERLIDLPPLGFLGPSRSAARAAARAVGFGDHTSEVHRVMLWKKDIDMNGRISWTNLDKDN